MLLCISRISLREGTPSNGTTPVCSKRGMGYEGVDCSGLVLLRPVLSTHTNLFRGQSITANLEHPARLFTGSPDRFACLPVLWRLRFVLPSEQVKYCREGGSWRLRWAWTVVGWE